MDIQNIDSGIDSSAQGPTGIPDPNNPGYDTAGYPLPGGRTNPPQATGTGPGSTPGRPAVSPDFGVSTAASQPSTTSGGGLLNLFPGAAPTYQGAVIGPAPVFTPPNFTPPPAFQDPTLAQAQAEPGFQFGVDQGRKQIEASAAARGVTNSGGTLKDVYDYGLNSANQNYAAVDNRARGNYLLNYQTQYTDPYKFAYQSASDAFIPKMAQYSAENNAAMQNSTGANNMNFNDWLQAYQIFRNRQLDSISGNNQTS